MVSCWGDFSVFLAPLGVIWRPGAPQGTARGCLLGGGPRSHPKSDENVYSCDALSGLLFKAFRLEIVKNRSQIIKKFARRPYWKTFCKKCCTRGPQGPAPTMKPVVSPTRNHCFHSSTSTSKVTENCLQWLPLWGPLGHFLRFWGPWGDFLGALGRFFGDKKIDRKKGHARNPGEPRKWGGGALKQSQRHPGTPSQGAVDTL